MKQSAINASFEESQKLVNEKYINKALKSSDGKVVRSTILGVTVTLLAIIGCYYFFQFLERVSETRIDVIPLRFGFTWHISCLIIYIYFFIGLLRVKSQKMLTTYYFTQVMSMAMTLAFLLLFLFLLSISVKFTNSYFLVIVYMLIFILFFVHQIISLINRIKKSLYGVAEYTNPFIVFFEKFMRFSRRYGAIVVIVGFFANRFLGDDLNGEPSFITQVLGLLSPVLALIGFIVIFRLSEEIMQGYYLNKYFEDYRELYDGSKKVWYGPRSKEYQEAVANGEEGEF
ncbi:hypothetical protein I6N95_26315 [Vagococcus sp. BWB3-3]|uniref:Uncharacterized protein n=1 Tax=Vagococcus allomyrinae TaxID=2794353 RepID=A0A940PGP9_9ENTE|nr:hypothetical protein [Vagococcus allomyrinae]MBP1044529.1 hypothetical protein [Vagococcus allomyrinae]